MTTRNDDNNNVNNVNNDNKPNMTQIVDDSDGVTWTHRGQHNRTITKCHTNDDCQ